MTTKSKVRVGIIGCGNISQAYFNGAKLFEVLEVVACADLNPQAAKAKARGYRTTRNLLNRSMSCLQTRTWTWSSISPSRRFMPR